MSLANPKNSKETLVHNHIVHHWKNLAHPLYRESGSLQKLEYYLQGIIEILIEDDYRKLRQDVGFLASIVESQIEAEEQVKVIPEIVFSTEINSGRKKVVTGGLAYPETPKEKSIAINITRHWARLDIDYSAIELRFYLEGIRAGLGFEKHEVQLSKDICFLLQILFEIELDEKGL